MASGFAFQTGVQPAESTGKLLLTFDVLVTGTDITEEPGYTYYPSAVTINANDTSLAIRTKVSQQVIADASAQGISLPASQLTLPTWQKG